MIEVPTFIKGKQGGVFLNPLTESVKGGVLVPASSSVPVTVNASGGASVPIALESESDSWSEVSSLIGQFSAGTAADVQNRLMCHIKDYRVGERSLSKGNILVNHVFGNTQNPFYLGGDFSESILLPPQQMLSFQFMNPSAAGAANFSFIAERTEIQNAARRDPGVRRKVKDTLDRQMLITPYWFTMDQSISFGQSGRTITAASKRNVVSFTNKQNCTLILTTLMGSFITTGVAGEVNEGFSFELFDPTSGAPLQTNPVTLNCGAGSSQFPYRLPFPIFLSNRQAIECYLTNLITDQSTDVFLTFFGVAVWNDPENVGRYMATGFEGV